MKEITKRWLSIKWNKHGFISKMIQVWEAKNTMLCLTKMTRKNKFKLNQKDIGNTWYFLLFSTKVKKCLLNLDLLELKVISSKVNFMKNFCWKVLKSLLEFMTPKIIKRLWTLKLENYIKFLTIFWSSLLRLLNQLILTKLKLKDFWNQFYQLPTNQFWSLI